MINKPVKTTSKILENKMIFV